MPATPQIRPFTTEDFARNPEVYFRSGYVWQVPVRVTHWVTAITISLLFVTGLYIANPVLSPEGEAWKNFVMGWMRKLHFAAGFVFAVSWCTRAYWFFFGNNYARSGFPMFWRSAWWRDLWRQLWEYLKLERGPIHLGHNALAGLSYTLGVVLLGAFQIVTGLALFSQDAPNGPMNRIFGWVLPLLGGPFRVTGLHLLAAWLVFAFVILHVYIVIYDSTQFRNGLISAMITGRKFYQKADKVQDTWLG
jgi:Ni/Fe-hydrogenase 1 B-type cytochrome subunit